MQRVNVTAANPIQDGESTTQWSDRLIRAASAAGAFRQCSLGWHDECSDPYGDECACYCHAPGIVLTRDQLESWAGRSLSDEEVDRLEQNISTSSIPDAIEAMVQGMGD